MDGPPGRRWGTWRGPGDGESLWGYAGTPTKGFAASTVLLRSGWCERVDFYGQPGVPERFKSAQRGARGFAGGWGGFGYHGRGAAGLARNTTDEEAAAEAAEEAAAGPEGVGLTRIVPGRTARDVELGAALQQERHVMHLMQALGQACFYE